MRYWIPALVILSVTFPAFARASCTTTREYITALEFLRDRKDMSLPEADSRKTARQVSRGCTGAARRFIRVTSVLSQAGLGPRDSIQAGLRYSGRSDMETETYLAVFQRAFLKEGLDLDLRSSILMAESLSKEFEGDTLAVRDDFEKLLDFCVQARGLDLPRPQCGAFAARVARLGQRWSGGIAAPFVRAFEFIRSEEGARLATGPALGLAEKLVAGGPDAPDNFVGAYRYAVSKKGLGLAGSEAVAFALEMGLGADPERARGSK